MKRRILTFAALAAALLTACVKEQPLERPIEEVSGTTLVFTASMEGAPESKATFDNTAKCASWEVGDQICINGFHYAANAAGTSTTFSETSVIRPVYVSTTTPNSYNNNYPPLKLVDEAGPSQEWCAHKDHKVDGVWNIVVSTGNATTLKSIQLWNARNTQNFPDRSWKDVNIYGSASADGPWGDPIKSFQDLDLAINNYGFAGELEIDATRPYTFYRIDVLDNKGSDYAQMSDMKFVISYDLRPAYVSSTDTGSYQNQPASKLVDDAGTSTRWIADKTQRHEGVWNIVVSTGSPTLLNTIKLWNAENSGPYVGRRWKEIDVSGRMTNQDAWRRIGYFENLNLAINNYDVAGEISINSSKPYTFYKIDILDNEGDSYMQMSDMKFTVDMAGPYSSYSPASLFDGITASLPSLVCETWAEGRFNMPMYANSEDTNLQFKNLCGVLKITVKKDQLASIKSIRVSSSNKATSGAFTVTNNTAVLTSPDVPANNVTVTYTNAVPTSAEGTVFYVAIPAQTYQNLKIELSSDGVNFIRWMTTKENTDIIVARNNIYSIIFSDSTRGKAKAKVNGVDTDVEWIQLWKDGPKFATINVGATKATDWGDYIGVRVFPQKVSDWGTAWRSANSADYEGLVTNCNYHWTTNYNGSGRNGGLYTGKGDYSHNSIFLPAAGFYAYYTGYHDRNGRGYYNSGDYSEKHGSESSYFKFLYFDAGNNIVKIISVIDTGSTPVRAVLKE